MANKKYELSENPPPPVEYKNKYDLSEFGPPSVEDKKSQYDLSEFAPQVDQIQNEQSRDQPLSLKSLWERYQDFMSPESKVDQQGQPLVETIFGRLPKNNPQFKPGTEENKKLVENLVDANAGMPGVQTVVQAPMKLTLKNIAKKILESSNKEKLYHETQYNRLWKTAEKAGIKNVKVNPKEINLEGLIENRANSKYIRPLERFMANPTLENAQTAQSDLGKLIRSPQLSKEVLGSEEQAVKNYAIKAQKHIKDMMFKNEKGELNQELKNTYDKITSSYKENRIPYKDKYITKFSKDEMTAKQLIPKLKNREFMAKKGAAHPEIERRDLAIQLAKSLGLPVSIASAFGLGLGGNYLINKLLGKSND